MRLNRWFKVLFLRRVVIAQRPARMARLQWSLLAMVLITGIGAARAAGIDPRSGGDLAGVDSAGDATELRSDLPALRLWARAGIAYRERSGGDAAGDKRRKGCAGGDGAGADDAAECGLFFD